MKEICLIIPSLRKGGAERVVSRLSYLFSQKGYKVNICLFDDNNIDYPYEGELFSINSPSKKGIFKALNILLRTYRLNKYKNEFKPNVIMYSFGNSANLINVLTTNKQKTIISIRGFGNLNKKNNLVHFFHIWILKYIFFRSNAILSVSKDLTHYININHKLTIKKTYTIPNGYDINNKLIKQERTNDKFTFVTMGSYRPEKNYNTLLEVMKLLKANQIDCKLIILGKGDDYQTYNIRNQISRLGLENSVELVGYHSNPEKLLSTSDCYVLSSISEGFPNALVEAMNCKLPIVSTNCKTGPREILDPKLKYNKKIHKFKKGAYGILVDDPNNNPKLENINNLYLAMKYMIENDEDRSIYSALAFERAQYYSFEKWIDSHEIIFNELKGASNE
ncbi:glycosyltransferase [Bacillus daqingensis]|uniref:Glycosyltransferase n=1 Tax=Bacillus daqingensis TaxID=872396 RepID=A0ABV9NP95_9BACI